MRTVLTAQDEKAFESVFFGGNLPGSCRLVRLPQVHDARGNITFVESLNHVPFEIQRVYYLYDVPSGAERAGHAHKNLEQVLVAASGSFDVHLENGKERVTVSLNRPDVGLYMRSNIWREIDNFSGGAVCLVMASLPYTESDYIREYADYIRAVGGDLE